MERQTTKRLSAGAVHLLRILQRLSEASARRGLPYAFPLRGRLAEEMGVGTAEVSRRIGELKRAGVMRVERADQPGGRNRYFLIDGGEVPVVRAVELPVVRAVELPVVRAVELPVVRAVELPVVRAVELPGAGAPLEGLRDVKAEMKQQQAMAAAAEFLGDEEAAREAAYGALRAAGMWEDQARTFSAADPALCQLGLQAWRLREDVTVGLLVRILSQPADEFDGDKDSGWRPREGTALFKSLKEAEAAMLRTAKREQQAQESATAAAERAAKINAREEAWHGLDDGERRAIEDGVAAKMHEAAIAEAGRFGPSATVPTIDRATKEFRVECRTWAVRFADARARQRADAAALQADAERWASLPEAVRQRATADAERYFGLFARGETRLSTCLEFVTLNDWLAVRRAKRGGPHP